MASPVNEMSPPPFKIAAAQVSSIRGNLTANIEQHRAAIAVAARAGVAVVVFPELSLIGYEPDLAQEFALHPTDDRLAPLVRLAKQNRMQVVMGGSITSGHAKPYLGSFVVNERGLVRAYAKMHLGGDEAKYFTPGRTLMCLESQGVTIGLSICADSSQRSHPAAYASRGATVYAASVFLNAAWYATDSPRFPAYATEFQLLVLMANHAASAGTLTSVGKSAAWGPDGALLAGVPDTQMALVVATRVGSEWTGDVLTM